MNLQNEITIFLTEGNILSDEEIIVFVFNAG